MAQNKNQIAYITGAGSGLGLGIAKKYLLKGYDLALFDLGFSEECRQTLLVLAQQASQTIGFYQTDITDRQSFIAATAKAKEEIGLPSLALNSAGVQKVGQFEQVSSDEFEKVVAVNLFGSRHFAEACIPLLEQTNQASHSNHKNKKNAKLVFISSMAGLTSIFGYASYCASKYGVVALAQTLRMELKPKGITVQVICPPEVDTPMVHEEHKAIHPATLKLKLLAGSLSLDDALDGILKGLNKNSFYIIPGTKAKITYWLNKLVPAALSFKVADSLIKNDV